MMTKGSDNMGDVRNLHAIFNGEEHKFFPDASESITACKDVG